jgi:serine/threonine protein kinase
MPKDRFCTRCGAELDSHGLCARCLFAVAAAMPSEGGQEAASTAPTPDELAPHFPSYELGELVGRGGMGFVYRARHRSLGRSVALKLLPHDIAEQQGFAERFAREARVLASLKHPSIVAVHDHGRAGPWWFLAMEFVEGANLRTLMRDRAIAPRQALALVAQICDALQYAHERNVIHRDVKPENILVDREGRVRILDFGLSKFGGEPGRDNLTRADQVMGTPHYMAPEQWERPSEVDHRADIYALGVVFYELLTGELPLGRFAPPSHKVAIDVRLDEVVLRSLAKEPERRYQHASEVKTQVEHVASTAAATTSTPAVTPTDARTEAPTRTRASAATHARQSSSTSTPPAPASKRTPPATTDLLDAILGGPVPARRNAGDAPTSAREPFPRVLMVLIVLCILFVGTAALLLLATDAPIPFKLHFP